MKPASFEYHAPATVDQAVTLLAELAPHDGRILAGGQSLVPAMAFRLARPAHLIDINGISSLAQLRGAGSELVIGAGIRHAAFHRSVVAGPLGRLLTGVVRNIGHDPIRRRGTFCGSIAHADPASEWCCLAATLGATIVVQSVDGSRRIAAVDFFAGIMATARAEDELVVEVRLKLLPDDTRTGFVEFSRRAGDFALGMALATYRLVRGRMVDVRLGIGGAESRPRRIAAAERILEGSVPTTEGFASAATAVALALDPLSDPVTSAEYRRDLVRSLARRALEQTT
jgi:carbon-monoxide dehydrogenase medium subunit